MKPSIMWLIIVVAIVGFLFLKPEGLFFLDEAPSSDIDEYCREVSVDGPSMEPTLHHGENVCVFNQPPKEGQLAVFKCKKCGLSNESIKRVAVIRGECYWLLGDNPADSHDSRSFGYLCPKDLEYIWDAKKSQ